MNKKTTQMIGAITTVIVAAAGLYFFLAPADKFEISLSPNPGRYTANDTVTIEVSTDNQGYELQSGSATFNYDPEYLTLTNIETENGVTAEQTDTTFTLNFEQDRLNSAGPQKTATITFNSAEAGVTSIELSENEFKDSENQEITPQFTTGRYAFNTTITPVGESEF